MAAALGSINFFCIKGQNIKHKFRWYIDTYLFSAGGVVEGG